MELVGKRVRNIEVKELVGKGGMGWVYLGFDHALHRQVALKVIRPAAGLSEENKARFIREARVLSQLEHENICRIYDFLDYNGSEILVLEYVEGKSLSKALDEGLSDRQRMSIARQLTAALIAAHGAGVVHRDLKPENVMWVADGRSADGLVKVLDFGLARSLQAQASQFDDFQFEDVPTEVAGRPEDDSSVEPAGETDEKRSSPEPKPVENPRFTSGSQVTRFGRVMGTISYMSPEQARGERLTTASDMFTLGLLFHEIFAGRPAYDPDLPTLDKLEVASLARTRPLEGIDPALGQLIRRLESPIPDIRPRAVDVLQSLDRIAERPKRRVRAGLMAAAVVIFALAGLKYTWDLKESQALTEDALRQAQAAQTAERQATDFLVDVFKLADPSQTGGEPVTVEELLRRGAEKIETELVDQPETQARLLQTLATVHDNLGNDDQALALLHRSVDILRKQERRPLLLAAALDQLAARQQQAGHLDQAASGLAESLVLRRQMLPSSHPDLAISLTLFGELRFREGKLSEAEALLEEALGILARPAPRVSDSGRERWARAAVVLAQVRIEAGDPVRAETLLRQAAGELEDLLGPRNTGVASALEILGRLLIAENRSTEALPMLERVLSIRQESLPPEHPDIQSLMGYLEELEGTLSES